MNVKDYLRFYGGLIAALTVSSLALVGIAGCGGSLGEGEESTLTVLAASSLTDAFGELTRTFEEQNPGIKVRASYAASSALLAQIQQGAPADVFASADEAKMNTAVGAGLVAAEPRIFARNRLVILVARDNPARIYGYRDLARPGTRLVLAGDEVPVAEYARESLNKADAEFGGGFEQDVLSNIVSREGDVRASANRVALGDADATFAYTSDVTPDIEDRVRVLEVPEKLNVVATYPIGTLKESGSPELAQKWVDLVLSEEGQQVLEAWGFEPAAR
jgi:molybdate transport system substrate-binding protein